MHPPASAAPPLAYTADCLVRMGRFRDGLASAARELLETHLALPQEVHYVADLQRWLLSQMTVAMHFENYLDPAAPPISAKNLVRALVGTEIASRNTVYGFLQELKRYGFVVPLPSDDRRQRIFRATEMSERLIRRYFDIHLRALDIVDDGQRYALSCRHPDILFRAQPRFARLLLAQDDWHKPPQNIAKFVRSDSGSSILHDLIKGIPPLSTDMTSPIGVGKVSPNAFSLRYRISRTHAARLFGLAREAGLVGWTKDSNRGDCWISPDLVYAYRHWQAVKLAAVSQAFHEACLNPDVELCELVSG
ncbi:hypothetical protein [Mesorhizobium sp. ANAO-SY3R2]|uniref:hypothetical protein n=1 Tax=Mesorhizobium sp. ANAO-SY3R2 TaxID=3166644 RepID=UPI0036731EA3